MPLNTRAIAGTVIFPLRVGAVYINGIVKSIGLTILQMLHAKGPAHGLRWFHRGMRRPQTRALSIGASASQLHELAPDVEGIIRNIHANKTKAVVYVTGGAVQSISWLLGVPGASATVLEAAVPYARESLISILGQEPEQYCSAATAEAIAEAAYRRAVDLSPFGSSVVGVGATCSLATLGGKRGDHRAYLAVHSGGGGRCVGVTLAKGARSRVGEDDLASRLLIKLLAESTDCDSSGLDLRLIPPAGASCSKGNSNGNICNSGNGSGSNVNGSEHTTVTNAVHTSTAAVAHVMQPEHDILHDNLRAADDPIARLLRGEVRCVEFCGKEVTVDAPRRRRLYLPGSFNPLHEGHRGLLAAAVKVATAAAGPGAGHVEGAFELTVQNADKGFLAEDEVRRRVAQFKELCLPVVVSCAPLFTDKSDLLSGSRFVVGYDTAARLVLPKYYGNSYTQMLLDFARLRHHGCSFIVAGRKDPVSGKFLSLGDLDMPHELADLFPLSLPEEDFRLDISSTQLRQKAQVQSTRADLQK